MGIPLEFHELKTFVFDDTEYQVNIQVLDDKPIFKAAQIGKIIGLKNIRSSIQHFDSDEKVVQQMDTLGGIQDSTFLTEMGVYRLLMRSEGICGNSQNFNPNDFYVNDCPLSASRM